MGPIGTRMRVLDGVWWRCWVFHICESLKRLVKMLMYDGKGQRAGSGQYQYRCCLRRKFKLAASLEA